MPGPIQVIAQPAGASIVWGDDDPFTQGDGDPFTQAWDTTDVNANKEHFSVVQTTNDIPIFTFGEEIIGVDLGFFDGLTQPAVAVIDLDNDSYIKMGFVSDDAAEILSDSTLSINASSISFNGSISVANYVAYKFDAADQVDETSLSGSTWRLLQTQAVSVDWDGGTTIDALDGQTAYFDQITNTADQATVVTIASTVYIKGAPIAGSNITYTNSDTLALFIDDGKVRIDGNVESATEGGYLLVGSTAASGTVPVFSFDDDADTGIGSSGVDVVTIIGGGEEIVRFAELASGRRTSFFSGGTITSGGTDDITIEFVVNLNDTVAAGGSDLFNLIKGNITQTDVTGWDNVNLMSLQIGGNTIYQFDNLGTLTIGNDTANLSGKIAFVASDGDAADILINTSDQLTFNSAGGGYVFDATIISAAILSVDDVTDATSAITGSIHTDGGLGVAGQIWVDGDVIATAGVRIGADSGDNEIDDAAQGSASTTLHIGNSSIDVTAPSDMRLKTDIVPSSLNALSLLNQLEFRDYGWKGKMQDSGFGLVSQEVNDIWSDMTFVEPGGIHYITYNKFMPYVIKAIQELTTENEQLRETIREMN